MSYRILIVDDSATTRALIKRTLRLAGLDIGECWEAGHGREALQQLRLHPVDLILADLHMPEMNGMELTRAVLSNPATAAIPVAVVSAEPSTGKLLELRKAGVRGYVRKPCTPESLRQLVAPLLEAPHA